MLSVLGLFNMKQFVFEKPHKNVSFILVCLVGPSLQDLLVLFEPKSLRMVLQEWAFTVRKTFAMKDFSGARYWQLIHVIKTRYAIV